MTEDLDSWRPPGQLELDSDCEGPAGVCVKSGYLPAWWGTAAPAEAGGPGPASGEERRQARGPGRRPRRGPGPPGSGGGGLSVTAGGTVTGPDRDSDLGTEDRALAPLTRDSID